MQSSICLIFTSSPSSHHLLWRGGGWGPGWWGGGGGVGRLFSNYAVWNNHARDISKYDLLSRRCRPQSSSGGGVTGWSGWAAAAISPTSLVTAAATSNSRHFFIVTDTHQMLGLIHLRRAGWLLYYIYICIPQILPLGTNSPIHVRNPAKCQ